MESTASGLEETIGRMRGEVFQIREIEIQIQRIALNAAIGAIHIGSPGRALSLIAEVMQDLAHDSSTNTESASLALDAMSDAVNRAFGGTKDVAQTPDTDAAGVVHQMRTALLELHASSRSSFDRVHQIAVAGSRLSAEISALRGSFTAARLFERVVNHVRDQVERIREQAWPGAGASVDGSLTEHMETLASQYTMQRERDVHDSLMQRPAAPDSAPPAVPKMVQGEDDLGDNVELF
jgi:methyl-accepting chemotaxis protein